MIKMYSSPELSGVTALDKALVRGFSQMTKEVNGAAGEETQFVLPFSTLDIC